MQVVYFIGIVVCAFFAPLWFFVIVGVLYAFLTRGYGLIVVGACVDAMFGDVAHFSYVYTLIAVATVCAAEIMKPYIIWYEV